MDPKFFMASKTIWGVIVMVIPTVSAFLGYDWSAQDAADLNAVGTGLGAIAEKGFEVVGLAITIYGRFVASGALKLKPGA